MSMASNEGEQNFKSKPLQLTALGRWDCSPHSSPSCSSCLFFQAGVSDSISASFAEYGGLSALAQCSKVKRHLQEVIRMKEGVICQNWHIKWIWQWWIEPLQLPFPLFLFCWLHLVRTSSQQEPVALERLAYRLENSKHQLQNEYSMLCPPVAAIEMCLNRPTAKALKYFYSLFD